MGLSTRKPSFVVASFTTAFLGAMAGAMLLTRKYVPPPPETRLANEVGAFVRAGARQYIEWLGWSEDPLAKARKRDVPIFLVVGLPWDQFGREMDRTTFRDPDVARYLNRHFVCVRVDGLEEPSFLRAYLPLSRTEAKLNLSHQMWVLDADGNLVTYIEGLNRAEALDPTNFTRKLIGARELFDRLSRDPESVLDAPYRLAQFSDLEAIEDADPSQPYDFVSFLESLRSRIPKKVGGIVSQENVQRVAPQALRFLSLTQDKALGDAIVPLVTSGMFDPIHGGFFNRGGSLAFQPISFSKVSTQNAEMAQVAAEVYRWSKGKSFRYIAEKTFDYLANEMSSDRGFYAGTYAVLGAKKRSNRFSFGSKAMSELFPGFLGFGLNPEGRRINDLLELSKDNSQAIPRFSLGAQENLESIQPAMDKMAAKRPLNPLRRQGQGYAEVHGTITARMIETARMLGDEDRLALTSDWVEQLGLFVGSRGVRHRFAGTERNQYLGDVLALADAYLQDFLATGRVPSLGIARTLLAWSQDEFAFDRTARTLREDNPLFLQWNHRGAELADHLVESSLARVTRLATILHRLLPIPADESVKGDPRSLAESALSMISGQSVNARRLGYLAGGLHTSALLIADDVHAFAVGQDAVGMANRLAQARPGRLVAPAVGPVRTDLQSREPGYYVISTGRVIGPLEFEDAARLIPSRFRLDRSL